MAPATPAIEVVDLEKRYGTVRAVDGLSVRIEHGEVFGLLGPNGAGKTTTVETLEGSRHPDAGTVRVLGLDPVRDRARLRPRIGVMLQEGGLHPGLRPHEALHLFASFYEDSENVRDLLELVGLSDVGNTVVRRLSGGQQRRLALALALVGRPEVVFLDEPTAGMDPHARATTWRLVRTLRERAVTVVLTTHGMDEAEQLCDRVAIVDRGKLVACASPAALTNAASSDETRFTATPGLHVTSIARSLGLADEGVEEARPGEYVVHAPASPGLVADLAIWLRDHEVLVGELRATRRSLEEVFLRLTGEGRG